MLIFVKDVLLCIISTKDSETNSELERERERERETRIKIGANLP